MKREIVLKLEYLFSLPQNNKENTNWVTAMYLMYVNDFITIEKFTEWILSSECFYEIMLDGTEERNCAKYIYNLIGAFSNLSKVIPNKTYADIGGIIQFYL